MKHLIISKTNRAAINLNLELALAIKINNKFGFVAQQQFNFSVRFCKERQSF